MFGEFLEERADFYRKQGVASLDATQAAVAEFMEEQVPLVAIPHRMALAVRDIMILQNRFKKIPGKRPQSVLARPGFMDALAYLRCKSEATGEGAMFLLGGKDMLQIKPSRRYQCRWRSRRITPASTPEAKRSDPCCNIVALALEYSRTVNIPGPLESVSASLQRTSI